MNPRTPPFILSRPKTTITNLPREIRDKIYAGLLQYHTQINIFPTDTITALPFLARRLPYSLLLNHQILEEAALVWLTHSKIVVELSAFSKFEKLLDRLPDNPAWSSVRELEFRGWQSCYANHNAEGTVMVTTANSVHDIATRCPGLKKLSMTLVPGALLYPKQFEMRTNFSRVLENKKVDQLCVSVDVSDMNLPAMGDGWESRFEKCTAALEIQAANLGRQLTVERRVHLPHVPANPNVQWRSVGHSFDISYDHPLA